MFICYSSAEWFDFGDPGQGMCPSQAECSSAPEKQPHDNPSFTQWGQSGTMSVLWSTAAERRRKKSWVNIDVSP